MPLGNLLINELLKEVRQHLPADFVDRHRAQGIGYCLQIALVRGNRGRSPARRAHRLIRVDEGLHGPDRSSRLRELGNHADLALDSRIDSLFNLDAPCSREGDCLRQVKFWPKLTEL